MPASVPRFRNQKPDATWLRRPALPVVDLQRPINFGLYSYWALGYAAGQNSPDTAGAANNSNDASPVNSPGQVAGHHGGFSSSFDGTTQSFTTGVPWSGQPTVYSFSAWVLTTTVAAGGAYIWNWRNAGDINIWFMFQRSGADLQFIVGDGTNVGTAAAVGALTANIWAHVVGVRNGNNLSIFANGGAQTGTNTTTFGNITTSGGVVPAIGTQAQTAAAWWNGNMADLRFYSSRALNLADAALLYSKPYIGFVGRQPLPELVGIIAGGMPSGAQLMPYYV